MVIKSKRMRCPWSVTHVEGANLNRSRNSLNGQSSIEEHECKWGRGEILMDPREM